MNLAAPAMLIYSVYASALTPQERFQAVRKLHTGSSNSNFMADKRVFIAGLLIIAILVVALRIYRSYRLSRQKEMAVNTFQACADRAGLMIHERNIVMAISSFAGLKNIDSVFTIAEAFDNGAAELMKVSFAAGKPLNERRELNATIIQIKEKLGFNKGGYSEKPDTFRIKGRSSRQIPVGKKLLLTKVNSEYATPMSAQIMVNDTYELKLYTDEDFQSSPGQGWSLHYQQGAIVWKFEAVELSSQDNELVLSHSNNIHFVNRRRFTHADVELPVFVAYFPSMKNNTDSDSMLPQFVRSKAIELSGPGLKVETSLKVKTGDHLLVILELTDDKLIQSKAEVRRCEKVDGKYLVGMEMVGVNGACLNELISATNHAAAVSAKQPEPEEEEMPVETQSVYTGND